MSKKRITVTNSNGCMDQLGSIMRKGAKILSCCVAGIVLLAVLFFVIVMVSPKWVYEIPYLARAVVYAETAIKGPVLPDMDGIYGIDVSKHQGKIDWKHVDMRYDLLNRRVNADGDMSREIEFVLAKATEGITITDSEYSNNRLGAKRHGSVFGAYHYFGYQSDPARQAEHFMKVAKLQKGDIVPVLDIEEDDNLKKKLRDGKLTAKDVREKAMVWLKTIEKSMGCKPIIYASPSFKADYLSTDDFAAYPFWVAHYQVRRPGYDGVIWQFTEKGSVLGIDGNVDINIFIGTKEDFVNLLID